MKASGRRHLGGGIWEGHGKDFGEALGGALTGGIWEKASGKRHLGRGIWEEASEGRYLGGLWARLWEGLWEGSGLALRRLWEELWETGQLRSTGKPGAQPGNREPGNYAKLGNRVTGKPM